MPRQKRYILPGQAHHIIQRGNNREPAFFSHDNYQFYEKKLLDACRKYYCELHAYVLMTNHVHLLMTPHTPEGISRVMQSVGRHYVPYINYRYGRTGSLWGDRHKSSLIDSEAYLLTCMRYIELNPVRAGIVAQPENYRWSSYHCNALGDENSLVTPHLIYQRLAKVAEERLSNYRSLFKESLSQFTLSKIREATNKGWILGNDRFRNDIKKLVDRQTDLIPKNNINED